MIPITHAFAAETVPVFGGGPVGARTTRRFATEATVVADRTVWKALDSGSPNARQLAEDVIDNVTGDST